MKNSNALELDSFRRPFKPFMGIWCLDGCAGLLLKLRSLNDTSCRQGGWSRTRDICGQPVIQGQIFAVDEVANSLRLWSCNLDETRCKQSLWQGSVGKENTWSGFFSFLASLLIGPPKLWKIISFYNSSSKWSGGTFFYLQQGLSQGDPVCPLPSVLAMATLPCKLKNRNSIWIPRLLGSTLIPQAFSMLMIWFRYQKQISFLLTALRLIRKILATTRVR